MGTVDFSDRDSQAIVPTMFTVASPEAGSNTSRVAQEERVPALVSLLASFTHDGELILNTCSLAQRDR